MRLCTAVPKKEAMKKLSEFLDTIDKHHVGIIHVQALTMYEIEKGIKVYEFA